MNRKIALLLVAALACPLGVYAEDLRAQNMDHTATRARMGTMKDQAQFEKMVNDAAELYASVAKGPQGEVPDTVLKNTRCIAVLPNVVTGAIVVGGTRGEGFASCKDTNNTWSQPTPISMTQGSIGLQAGAKAADLVLYFQSREAVQALKRGDFKLGTDVSAVAGSYDRSLDTSTAGVVVYSRAEGLFAGASVSGSRIGKNQSEIARFYGKKADYTALLEGRESPANGEYSRKLTQLFPS